MRELENGLPGVKYSDGAPAVPLSISRSRTVYLPAGSLISWFSAVPARNSVRSFLRWRC